ncbi:MAG TPA: hypothetical protein VNO51_17590 [Ilumatobacteraceae bacterium]|nr:hypothetical protein [Ilumatobacteraceae bacterium]
MSVMMLEIDELVDVESLGDLDGRQLAELFKRLERLRRCTEGALAAVIGEVDQRNVHRADGHNNVNLVSGVGPLVRQRVSRSDPHRQPGPGL